MYGTLRVYDGGTQPPVGVLRRPLFVTDGIPNMLLKTALDSYTTYQNPVLATHELAAVQFDVNDGYEDGLPEAMAL
ncbi:hypothetical protein RRF57_010201 [Xylaria bambusicola]|uniref:Uncharacterized protein n=1 Tax=Xylaria bambusicola TaxID=326684 RepID=A0AAN7UWA0_9PEZI